MLSKYFKNQRDQTDFFIAILVIALAGLLIGYYSFNADNSIIQLNTQTQMPNPRLESLEIDGKTFVAIHPMPERKHNHKNIDNEYAETVPNQVIADSLDKNKVVDGKADIEEDEVVETATDENIDEDDFEEEDIDLDEDITELDSISALEDDIVLDEVIESDIKDTTTTASFTKKESSSETSSKSSTASNRGDCIIVIGAFGDAINVKKLIGKLDNQGYSIFKVPFKGLTRVGIYEDCAIVNKTLKKIRRKYYDDAFIMQAK